MTNPTSALLPLAPVVSLATALALATACQPMTPPPDGSTGACDLASAAPVVHTATRITADERWTAGVHQVDSTVTVAANVTLTIDPCSEVRLGPDASLTLDADGARLIAEGSDAAPIRFVRADASRAWGRVQLGPTSSARLAYVTLDGGGGTNAMYRQADYAGAALAVRGDGATLPTLLRVDHVTVRGATGLGVALVAAGFAPDSSALTVTASGWHPVYLGADVAGSLPQGSYTGNGIDEVLLQDVGTAAYDNGRPLRGEVALHDRGVPYRVGADGTTGASVIVGDGRSEGPAALLRIEAGVTVRFVPQTSGRSQLLVRGHQVSGGAWQPQGALVVEGTESAPVTLTSASAAPRAGDWAGLYFQSVVDPRTHVDHAVIEYAGGDSGAVGVCVARNGAPNPDADCAVILMLERDMPPAGATLTNSLLRHSAGCGVYRGWAVADVDFTASNSFDDVAGCTQSNVPDARNACPMSPCPMP